MADSPFGPGPVDQRALIDYLVKLDQSRDGAGAPAKGQVTAVEQQSGAQDAQRTLNEDTLLVDGDEGGPRYIPGGPVHPQTVCQMGCHGVNYSGRRYETEAERAELERINTVAQLAIGGVGLVRPAVSAIGYGYQALRSSVGTVDLFGGVASQIPRAVNVDLAATPSLFRAVRTSVGSLPFRTASANNVIASGPQAPFLEEAARVLAPGGRLVINSTKGNKFGKLPDAATLERLGLRVERPYGDLLPEFANVVFRRTDGTVIPAASVRSVVLRRAIPQ